MMTVTWTCTCGRSLQIAPAVGDQTIALLVTGVPRGATSVDVDDVQVALDARRHRNDYPEQRLQQAIVDGDRLIEVSGEKLGQVNGLSVVDLGDHEFGLPVRLDWAAEYRGKALVVYGHTPVPEPAWLNHTVKGRPNISMRSLTKKSPV